MTASVPPEDRRWWEWAWLIGRRVTRLLMFLVALAIGLYWGTRGARAWAAAILPNESTPGVPTPREPGGYEPPPRPARPDRLR